MATYNRDQLRHHLRQTIAESFRYWHKNGLRVSKEIRKTYVQAYMFGTADTLSLIRMHANVGIGF
jgi:hypothetical protein